MRKTTKSRPAPKVLCFELRRDTVTLDQFVFSLKSEGRYNTEHVTAFYTARIRTKGTGGDLTVLEVPVRSSKLEVLEQATSLVLRF